MNQHYDIAGRVTVAVSADIEQRSRQVVAAQLDPFRGVAAVGAADVVIDVPPRDRPTVITELHHAAGDATTTGCDGESLYLRMGRRWCRLPDLLEGGALRFELAQGFPLARAFGTVVRPALQLGLLRRGFVAVHSTGVELDGGGVVVAGWSESGKTETALALMESGARFLTDKWTVVGPDGTLTAFPIGVGVRRWVLPYLPRLRAALPASSRAQFAAAAAADGASRPVRERASGRLGGLAADTASRAVALADRAALTPSQLRAAYGQADDPGRRIPVRCVALLINVDDDRVRVEPADPAWAAERLARSAAFERRPWYALQERARYAMPARAATEDQEAIIDRERAQLEPVLSDTQVVSVKAPFPADPRRVAQALMASL
ncbi:MAG: hypothetical protein JWO02_2704 [Solirubrobacterales bacterium]|nr:hypothetical protein [Solirubrobacterales bacterium]